MRTAPADVSRLVLDLDAWTTLTELLPGLRLPSSFAGGWGPEASPEQIGAARSAALDRLRERGLVIGADTIHPSLVSALEVVARASLRVDLRTWQGDRAATSELALSATAGVSLTRLHHVATGGNGPHIDADAVGVELALFRPPAVLGAIRRLLPPAPEEAPADPARIRLDWPDLLALSAALKDAGSPGRVADDVVGILVRAAGLSTVPPLLRDLSSGLDGAVRISVTAGAATWFGLWLRARDQLAGLRPAGGGQAWAGPDEWPSEAPAHDGTVEIQLWPVGPADFEEDLLTTLTAAFETAGLAGEIQ